MSESISFIVPYRWLEDRAGRLENTLRQLGELVRSPDEILVIVMPTNEIWCRAVAINRGVRAARNEWVCVTSIDMDWSGFNLERLRKYLVGDRFIEFPHPIPGRPDLEKGGDVTVFRRSTWERLGGFDEDFKGWGWEDIDWRDRCREDGVEVFCAHDLPIPHIPHPVYTEAPYWVGQLKPFYEWKRAIRAERRRWLEDLGLR